MVTVEIYSGRMWPGVQRWRWRAVAGNGEVVASGESYRHRADCVDAVELLFGPAAEIKVAS